MGAIDPAIGALVVALIGPLGAYLIAARRFSGKITSSDARDLWAESRSIRQWSQKQLDALTATVARQEQRIRTVEQENTHLRATVSDLTAQLEHAEARVADLEQAT